MAYIFMSQVLEEFEFSIGALRKDGRGEWFHDLLHGHWLPSKLIFGRAVLWVNEMNRNHGSGSVVPHQSESAHANRLQISIPALHIRCRHSEFALWVAHLLVISKVVPKI